MRQPSLIHRGNLGVSLVLVPAIAGACMTAHSVESSLSGGELSVAHVIVENQSPFEIQVYLFHSGARSSLGRVPASRSARLVLPSTSLRAGFVALVGESRPRIENTRYTTDPLNVLPGQTVRWRLEATGGRSFVSITGIG